jgi:iron(III) transport system permease protein
LFPLAAPAYILAYTYTDLLEYYGPVQSILRQWFGWKNAQDYWFTMFDRCRSDRNVCFGALSYVYSPDRLFKSIIHYIEASRSLGCTPSQGFLKVALPMARPAIVVGLSLALMETW